ncbi:MAG TPA: hypothetical protein ENL03_04350, partial [Phycisphaerae bacterium]|nr:hypothetical protein [Phycisphaerae bacterium]
MTDLIQTMIDQDILGLTESAAVRAACAEGMPLDEALLARSGLADDKVIEFLAQEFSVPLADLDGDDPDMKLVTSFPARILLAHTLLPLYEQDGNVILATAKLFDTSGIDELHLASGREFEIALAPPTELARMIQRLLGLGADTVESMIQNEDGDDIQTLVDADGQGVNIEVDEDASISRFVNQVLMDSLSRGATDLHFEPFDDELRVRARVDGLLQEIPIPMEVRRYRSAIVSRLKILSQLD